MEAMATVGSCGNCWKLRLVASKARNMTGNALSILIVTFSVQLQQTENSDRKLFLFHHGWWCGSRQVSSDMGLEVRVPGREDMGEHWEHVRELSP